MAQVLRWHLGDGEAERDARLDFAIPPKVCRAGLRPGWNVKLLFMPDSPHPDCEAERMWVEVVQLQAGTRFVGRLLNEPHYLDGIHAGDLVEFGPEHVIGLDAPADEVGYDREAWVAMNRRVLRSRQRPGRLIWNSAAKCWYAFVGDEDEAEREDGSDFDWAGLDELVDRFPELHDVFSSKETRGAWDYDPVAQRYDVIPFSS